MICEYCQEEITQEQVEKGEVLVDGNSLAHQDCHDKWVDEARSE